MFYELLGLTQSRAEQTWKEAQEWLANHKPTENCRLGLSPHAPYSVRASLFEQVAACPVPIALHLAETLDEKQLVEQHSGSFVEFLGELGVWDESGLVESLDHLLQIYTCQKPLLIHGNYLDPNQVLPGNSTVVYCPRTHAAFGHSAHPFREFLQRGIRIAIGTDSLASNPDLSILSEIRFLHRRYPDIPGLELLRMATLSGAEALEWDDITGSLIPGKSADLIVVPLSPVNSNDPYALVLNSSLPVQGVLCQGRWLIPPFVTKEQKILEITENCDR